MTFPGTVADNLCYGPALQGRELSANEIAELLTLADLDPFSFPRTAWGGLPDRSAFHSTQCAYESIPRGAWNEGG